MCLVAGCLLHASCLLLRSQDLEIELSKFESVIQSVQQSGLTTPKLSSSSELASGSPSKRHNIALNDPETPNTKKVQFYSCFYVSGLFVRHGRAAIRQGSNCMMRSSAGSRQAGERAEV
jgi:hypothetical protein